MPTSISSRYADLIATGEIERDPAQEAVIGKLAEIETRLHEQALARKSSALGWLFGRREKAASVRGLYIHGDVGRGKTMLMDLFFATSTVPRKRRAHFHEFMQDVHERVHAFRHQLKYGEIAGDDPVRLTADSLADEASLLCFDEFHVNDIADAMILGRLFAHLFERGVVVVATSNVAPDDLYKEGLNRGLFVPFIEQLKQRLETVRLDARTDFRLEKLGAAAVWHVPADDKARSALDATWRTLTAGEPTLPRDLRVRGRVLHVPYAARGVARFSFAELCGAPTGAADFIRIAREFHTLLLDEIPVMGFEQRNEAKRFVTLVDTLYDSAVKLAATADAEPNALYLATEGIEALEFKRTVSRLIEMRSESYLSLPHGPRQPILRVPDNRIVET
jgi:cell division protein ZapE